MKIYSEFDDDVEDSLEVIPLVLSEQDVRELSDEVLRLIADCSTKVVVDVLKRDYLSNTKADPAVQAKIRKAYSYQLGRDAYLDSEEVANNVDMLRDVNYSTIVAEMPVHQLQGSVYLFP